MRIVFLSFENYTLTTDSLPGYMQIRFPSFLGKVMWVHLGDEIPEVKETVCSDLPYHIPRDQWLPFPQILSLPAAASGASFPLWGPLRTPRFGTGSAVDCWSTASPQH